MDDAKRAAARKALAKYPELVLNALDAQGRPYSVRQAAGLGADGSMTVHVPAALGPAPGPASLLGHHHDANLWNMHMVAARGRLECAGEGWRFVLEAYDPPSQWARMRGATTSAKKYLEKRGLAWPTVNWAGLAKMWVEADALRKGGT